MSILPGIANSLSPRIFSNSSKSSGDSEFAMPASIDTAGTQDKGITNNNDNAQNRVDSLAQAINGTNSNNSVQVNKKVATTANKKPSSTSAEVDNDPGNLGSAR